MALCQKMLVPPCKVCYSFNFGWSSGISATAIQGFLGLLVEGGADNVNQCFLEASCFGSTELVRILLQMSSRPLITRRGRSDATPDPIEESTLSASIVSAIESTQVPMNNTTFVRLGACSARRRHSKKRGEPRTDSEPTETTSSDLSNRNGVVPNDRGINKCLATQRITRTTKAKIHVVYIFHLRKASEKIHSLVAHDIGAIVRTDCKMWASIFKKLDSEYKRLCWDQLLVNFEYDLMDPDVNMYLTDLWQCRYREWNSELNTYYKNWSTAAEAKANPSNELANEDRKEEWIWLCTHFETPEFLR